MNGLENRSFLKLLDQYHPQYLLHGHVHLNYSHNIQREREYGDTRVINCCQRFELEYGRPTEYTPLTPLQRFYAKHFIKNLQIIGS